MTDNPKNVGTVAKTNTKQMGKQQSHSLNFELGPKGLVLSLDSSDRLTILAIILILSVVAIIMTLLLR